MPLAAIARSRFRSGLGALSLGAACTLLCGQGRAQVTERVSIAASGLEGNAPSWGSGVSGRMCSADGRFIAFVSYATNLVPGDMNGNSDVFVRDRLTGVTELASVDSSGVHGNFASGIGVLCVSTDGSVVAFDSEATNLVTLDTNGQIDVFVHDRTNGVTERVSDGQAGAQGNHASLSPALSGDGRFVAFYSVATNLVNGDTNGRHDCFVRDRLTGTLERVSVSTGGAQGDGDSRAPRISSDGRFVAFTSLAANLVSGDTNGTWDVFLRDRTLGTTVMVSVNPSGTPGSGSSQGIGGVSSDGRFVVFGSLAPDLVPADTNGASDAMVRDTLLGVTERVSLSTAGFEADGASYSMSISDDGRFVAFQSVATNLVGGDTNGALDVFVRDRVLNATERVSVSTYGVQPSGDSDGGGLTPDGRFVQFASSAVDLVPGDTNVAHDVFIRDRFASGFTSICDPGSSGVANCPCNNAPSSLGRGCDNSSFTGGAALSAGGIAYLSTDSLAFTTTGEKPSATSILIQGDAQVPGGTAFGQGVRCVGGTLKRLYVKTAQTGSITAPDLPAGDPTVSARSAALGAPIQPGQPYSYLVYYRDPGVLGGCSALATFNCTQTGLVSYWP